MSDRNGRPVRGYMTSSNATTAVAVTLYEQGSATEITLGADEFLIIDSGFWSAAPAVIRTHLYTSVGNAAVDPANTCSDVVYGAGAGTGASNSWQFAHLYDGWCGARGATPKVIAQAAGLVSLVITGRIVKA